MTFSRPKIWKCQKNLLYLRPKIVTFSNMKQIPYGITDFELIRKEDYYYVDKTRFIGMIEQEARYVFLLRPRRFGKSLLTNAIAAYYDLRMADKYEAIFKGTDIYANPTKERNKYMVLKFNFSGVDSNPDKVEASFNERVLIALDSFIHKYQEYLPVETLEWVMSVNVCHDAFARLMEMVTRSEERIYLLVDEYDNFANTLLSYDEKGYMTLTHGTGFFRLFFNQIKAATTDNSPAISRMFITGVTPLTLSDVTSGFNIGCNLSMKYEFNEAMGFNESEVRAMLEYYRDAAGTFHHSVDELIEIMKPYYNNSCFNASSLDDDRMFNSDMVLYFMRNYVSLGKLPESMIDFNVSSDMNKIRKMVSYDKHNDEKGKIIERILNDGYIKTVVTGEFKLADLGKKSSLVSLLYYLGLLSYGKDSKGYTALVITNQTIREQYYTYLTEFYAKSIGWQADEDELIDLGVEANEEGSILPLLSYICEQMNEQSSNRDFNREGESFVKGYIVATMGNNNNYFVCRTEKELNHGYCDISMTPRQGGKHAYLVELKYVKPSETDEVAKSYYEQAISQLHSYANSHPFAQECADHNWTLHTVVLVVNGWKVAYLEEVV